ncbi:O-antigen transporter [Thermus composti]|uniref:Oligosaccharide flippase family protein n=1 Tax=Thermus composti TaxID=532059 RepID=A0ABV6Q4F0_9DEIN|nr:oligosaccharide flippase family protein [Thermus composti]GGN00276.1 O-antigen transporter [Thermus composti]
MAPWRLVRRALGSNLGRNLFYLYLVQGANYLFPLLTLPYLSRVLGPEGFGKLALAQASVQYLYLVLDYGFGLSATREVARSRQDPARLGEILAGVFHARLLLVLPTFFLAFLLYFGFPFFQEEKALFFGALLAALGQGLNTLWFFQGLEEMRAVALLEGSIRGLTTLGIFLLVRDAEDLALPLFLQAFAAWMVGLWGMRWALGRVFFPGLRGGWAWLRRGLGLFAYSLATLLYTSLNVALVSLFVPPGAVGHYAAAERLVRPLVNLWAPLSRLFFPRLSFAWKQDRREAWRWVRYGGLATVGLGLGVSLFLFLTSPWLVPWFLGPGYEDSVLLVRVMSLFLLLSSVSSFLGMQVLLPMGLDRPFLWLTLGAGMFNIVLGAFLVWWMGVLGMAWGMVVVELGVVLGMFWVLGRTGFGGRRT